jgi:uncharacterized protein (TIGR02421 family)
MSARPTLELAADSNELRFGPRGELRESFGETGRVHFDRWLPFLVIHCTDKPEDSIGRRVATNSPAYLIWSPQDDCEAQGALEVLLPCLREKLGPVLILEVFDAPAEPQREDSPKLPGFDLRLTASDTKLAAAALDALKEAASEICVDLRGPDIAVAPAGAPLAGGAEGADRVSITIPHIHRAPDGRVYPQLAHELASALIEALLCAAAAFIGEASRQAPPHFRTLGRSAFLSAALHGDKKLDAIARSFDFLLSVTPINMTEAKSRFLDNGEDREPEFRYRPLSVDPDLVKRDLYAIDLSILEDLLLERLLSEKRREIDMQLTMLGTRNTSGFRPASMLLYGTVTPKLLADAHSVLSSIEPRPAPKPVNNAGQVAAAAQALVDRYRAIDPRFAPTVEVRDDVFGLLVSGDRLMIASNSAITAKRLDALLAHEVSVHLLTYFNGATQGLTIFRTGLAHYEGIQEGLGVFAEWAVGGLTPSRLRLLAGRVVAVDAMINGASFIEVYRLLQREMGFSKSGGFDITARVFRSGGLAKDAIYLKGFLEVLGRVASGASMDAFWLGKIAPEHVDAVEELLLRGLLHAPVFEPEFLSREDAHRRIGRLRGGEPFDRMLELE